MRFSYDAESYDPPAPVAMVSLQTPDGEKVQTEVPMLMDTGADVTLVPRWAVDALGLVEAQGDSYELAGFDGTTTVAVSVRLALLWLGKTFRGQFLVIDQPHGILGRNLLNNVTLTFHGPQHEWEV